MKTIDHIKSMLAINIAVNRDVKKDNEKCKEIIKYMDIEIEVYKKVQRYIEIMELTHGE